MCRCACLCVCVCFLCECHGVLRSIHTCDGIAITRVAVWLRSKAYTAKSANCHRHKIAHMAIAKLAKLGHCNTAIERQRMTGIGVTANSRQQQCTRAWRWAYDDSPRLAQHATANQIIPQNIMRCHANIVVLRKHCRRGRCPNFFTLRFR